MYAKRGRSRPIWLAIGWAFVIISIPAWPLIGILWLGIEALERAEWAKIESKSYDRNRAVLNAKTVKG